MKNGWMMFGYWMTIWMVVWTLSDSTTTTTTTDAFCLPVILHSSPLSLSSKFISSSSSLVSRLVVLQATNSNNNKKSIMDKDELKRQLQDYLEKRKQVNADELAKQEKGKVIGGTKGNVVLEYISGAPVKEQTIDKIPNIFDYDELTKYGYSHLVTPIMDMGGRKAVYDWMEMEAPIPQIAPPKEAPKLVIDRQGKEDKARYSGLKMTQVLDDDALAQALERAREKEKLGQELRPKLMEEEFERPFADKRNTGPRLVPDWTPERLDEYTKSQGRAISWARRARLGEFVQDENESLWELSIPIRLYCVLVAMELAFAFGKSTPTLFETILHNTNYQGIIETMQIPGLTLAVASIGSCIYCGWIVAPQQNRNSIVWAIKGLLGGPLAIRELKSLETLMTQQEQQDQQPQN